MLLSRTQASARTYVRTYEETTYVQSMYLRLVSCARRDQKSMPDYAEKLLAIAECELCDDTGLRLNQLHRCDHIDYAAIAKRHVPVIKAALKKGRS